MHPIRTLNSRITYRITYKACYKDLVLKRFLCICDLEQCVMFLMSYCLCVQSVERSL